MADEMLSDNPNDWSLPGGAAAVPAIAGVSSVLPGGVVISTRGSLSVKADKRWVVLRAMSQTTPHQLDHLLGLEHTSVFDASTRDRHTNTPENDNEDLMHADGTGLSLRPQQVRTLTANPDIVHFD